MRNNLFSETGVHVVVDGQYGSTGKGVLAAWLAFQAHASDTGFDVVVSNAGPNSGHTFYRENEKHVLKQLPTFAVASYLMGRPIPVFLSAGAIIDYDILEAEMKRYPGIDVIVHPNAAVISGADKAAELNGTIAAVAGTRSGTGAALARKVLRDPLAVAGGIGMPCHVGRYDLMPFNNRVFMEVSQGFSLGINQMFYPKCTSRECTVSQAMADASLPPRSHAKTYMSMRTFPIRVGNVDGHSSGEWYPDQTERTWEEIGQVPERTTVTNRIRRVADFSVMQFEDALRANDPDFVFLNFMNYLNDEQQEAFMVSMDAVRDDSDKWFDLLLGYGPTSEDVHVA